MAGDGILPAGLPRLGRGFSSNLSAGGSPQRYRLLERYPGAFDYPRSSSPRTSSPRRSAASPAAWSAWRAS